MNGIMNKAAVTATAAVAAIGIGIGPAAAATVTVSGGPNFTAVSTNMKMVTGSATITCMSITMSGSVTDGSYTTPAQIGSIPSSSWSGCTALGSPATFTQNGTWQVWVTGASSGAVTPGEIRNVDLTEQIASMGCTVHWTGTLPEDWTNSPEGMTFTGGALSTVGSGFCPGLGSTGSMSGNLAFTGSPTDPIVLS